ncbi:hypothetical protein HanIR_Chr01g0015231 [Helianthus annuus]|nr:hypothetical protein HanIR_Chr01g0015231 [Helianthus annuus]
MMKGVVQGGGPEGVRPCPFRNFHYCKDGFVGSKGYARLLSHFQRDHLKSDNRKDALRDAIAKDPDLYEDVGETLKTLNNWLCGECMVVHALSRGCHHVDDLVKFVPSSRGTEDFIVGIPKPQVSGGGASGEGIAPVGVDGSLLERVFSLPITTVKSIPPSCRMAFAQALTSAMRKVVATPGSVEYWVKLLLLPRCTLKVVRPANRQERRSGNRKTLQCFSIQRALSIWKDGEGISELVASLFQDVKEKGAVTGSDRQEGRTNVKQCLRKVADGHFTAAVKVLSSSGVAPLGPSTLKALAEKHPVTPPPVVPADTIPQAPLTVDAVCVLGCIKSFPKGTSCGRDGLRAQHLLDSFCGEGSSTSSGLVLAITGVVNVFLGGVMPQVSC